MLHDDPQPRTFSASVTTGPGCNPLEVVLVLGDDLIQSISDGGFPF
jgi:hypothetical protein